MRRLILLPYYPNEDGGYAKAVRADLAVIRPTEDDRILVYAPRRLDLLPGSIFVPRVPRLHYRRALPLLRGRPTAELPLPEFRRAMAATGATGFDSVFCGDTVLYRAAKALFTRHPMIVRFHNLFTMAKVRLEMQGYHAQPILRYNLAASARLEREILRDRNARCIFITAEEERFAKMLFPRLKSQVWPIHSIWEDLSRPPVPPKTRRLVFLGSLAYHTAVGVEFFIRRTFPQLRARLPRLEVFIYGGPHRYHRPADGVHCPGRYEGEGYPFGGDALFIVPDLLGGGIKVKVGDMLAARISFISTPFGVEGYTLPASPDILVKEIDDWPESIERYFDQRVPLIKPDRQP